LKKFEWGETLRKKENGRKSSLNNNDSTMRGSINSRSNSHFGGSKAD
jgi:hypothetical protein